MIVRAVESLKERRGSSSRAIAKFISVNYSDLPVKHAALVKRHLRRLKKQGVLLMVKHSYKLAGGGTGADGEKRKPGRPRKAVPGGGPAPADGTRKRGRPPKIHVEGRASNSGALVLTPRRKPGRPPKVGPVAVQLVEKQNPDRQPKAAAAADQPSGKRKPGRPPKALAGATPSVGKRKPGRPPKVTSVTAAQSGEKRKRGRPPQALVDATSSAGKRRPGRPPKAVVPAALLAPKRQPGRPPGSAASLFSKKRGRPKKIPQLSENQSVSLHNGVPGGIAIVIPIIKRRGRPPKKKDAEAPTGSGTSM